MIEVGGEVCTVKGKMRRRIDLVGFAESRRF